MGTTIIIERGNLTLEDGWQQDNEGQLYAAYYDEVLNGLVAIGFNPENAAHNLARLEKQVNDEISARRSRRDNVVNVAVGEVIQRHENQ